MNNKIIVQILIWYIPHSIAAKSKFDDGRGNCQLSDSSPVTCQYTRPGWKIKNVFRSHCKILCKKVCLCTKGKVYFSALDLEKNIGHYEIAGNVVGKYNLDSLIAVTQMCRLCFKTVFIRLRRARVSCRFNSHGAYWWWDLKVKGIYLQKTHYNHSGNFGGKG